MKSESKNNSPSLPAKVGFTIRATTLLRNTGCSFRIGIGYPIHRRGARLPLTYSPLRMTFGRGRLGTPPPNAGQACGKKGNGAAEGASTCATGKKFFLESGQNACTAGLDSAGGRG